MFISITVLHTNEMWGYEDKESSGLKLVGQ